MSAPPSPLPPRGAMAGLDARRRRISPRVGCARSSIPRREARVYSGGAGLRDDVKAPRLFRFRAGAARRRVDGRRQPRPCRQSQSRCLAQADRGAGQRRRHRRRVCAGRSRRAGSSRPIRSGRTCGSCATTARWRKRYGWGEVAPFYIEMESPAPAGGVPRPGRLAVKLRNDHLGYALTWFGLAAVLVGVFGFWAARPAARMIA